MVGISVKFSGKVQEYAQEAQFRVEELQPLDVSALLKIVVTRFPEIDRITKHLFISINGKLVTRDHPVHDGDEVALFFRMGGG